MAMANTRFALSMRAGQRACCRRDSHPGAQPGTSATRAPSDRSPCGPSAGTQQSGSRGPCLRGRGEQIGKGAGWEARGAKGNPWLQVQAHGSQVGDTAGSMPSHAAGRLRAWYSWYYHEYLHDTQSACGSTCAGSTTHSSKRVSWNAVSSCCLPHVVWQGQKAPAHTSAIAQPASTTNEWALYIGRSTCLNRQLKHPCSLHALLQVPASLPPGYQPCTPAIGSATAAHAPHPVCHGHGTHDTAVSLCWSIC